LDKKLSKDLTYTSGKILGSMCTTPHEFGIEVYSKYFQKNLGDPGIFPGSEEIEQDLISVMGNLFGGNSINGSIVSGGSEANIIAMRIAKKLKPNVKNPEIVCSENAHISFHKAADILGIKIRSIPLTEDYIPNMSDFASKINKNTIALIGIAGTTSLGLVEQIDQIAKLAEQEHLYLHVDAAFGGFVLPFMEELGYNYPLYDFRLKEVDSLTADPHKMGLGLIPSGGFLIREHSIVDKFGFSIPYLAGGDFKHLSLTGTRPGGPVIAFWALMKYLGRDGFRKIVKECWENTLYLEKGINEIEGIEVPYKPSINIVGIKSTEKKVEGAQSVCRIDKNLRKIGWALGVFKKLNLARICVMPHITKKNIEKFLIDLEKVVKKIRIEG
ncbi:MAG: tyrosine decarboxylase MfnA, partial [Promethearchaeota archaeon]